MGLDTATVKDLLLKALPSADVEVIDSRGDSKYFGLVIKSALFKDISRLNQHRLVYKALGDHVSQSSAIFSMRTALPDVKKIAIPAKIEKVAAIPAKPEIKKPVQAPPLVVKKVSEPDIEQPLKKKSKPASKKKTVKKDKDAQLPLFEKP